MCVVYVVPQRRSIPRGTLGVPDPVSVQSSSPNYTPLDLSTSYRESHLTSWLAKARAGRQQRAAADGASTGVGSQGTRGTPATPRRPQFMSALRRKRGEADTSGASFGTSMGATSLGDLLSSSVSRLPPRPRGESDGSTGDIGNAVATEADGTSRSPLSLSQHSLWFLHKMDPSRVDYVVHFAALLEPRGVDLQALRGAIVKLVDRHAALRTTYVRLRWPCPLRCCACGRWCRCGEHAVIS